MDGMNINQRLDIITELADEATEELSKVS